jgi:hypothetical protein
MAIVFGNLNRADVQDFLDLCEKRSWVVVKNTPEEIAYLDRSMNRHSVKVVDRDGELWVA